MKKLNKIIIIIVALLLCIVTTSSAQGLVDDIKAIMAKSDIYPDGTIYFEKDGKRLAIPFAVVNVYDNNDHTKLVYHTMADRFGHYQIAVYDYTKPYHYVIEATGFETTEYDTDKLNTKWPDGSPFYGNSTIDYKLTLKEPYKGKPYTMKSYKESDLTANADPTGWIELACTAPGIKKEDDDIVTTDGGSVRLKMNDAEIPAAFYKYLSAFPCFMVSEIEVYALPEGGTYSAVVNIVGSVGKRITENFNKFEVFNGE